ncbi:MAG: glycosyltransferase [Clostridia bacterium]|nr:glycosyltransferase [Clostridia bacterium]
MALSVVLLAYNEAENLINLLPRINKVIDGMKIDYDVFIIDSPNSTDNTEEVCKKNNAKYVVQEFPNYSGAFMTGIKYADKDRVLVMDADDSHNPDSIPAIYSKFSEGNDIVIGSRYTKGGKTHDFWYHIVMSKLLNFVMRLVVGVKARDISTSFRIYDAKQLKAVELKRNNYDVLQEVILKMKFNNPKLKIDEVPITFDKRAYGKSKRKFLKFAIGYITSVTYFIGLSIKNVFSKKK